MDDQLAGLVVEGELAEVLENVIRLKTRKESCKALTNTIWSVKKKTDHPPPQKKKKKTDHPTCKVVVLPRGEDNSAVLVEADRARPLHQAWVPDVFRLKNFHFSPDH